MTERLFKRSEDGAILCEACLPPHEVLLAAELSPSLFPGTFHLLRCSACSEVSGAGGGAGTVFTPGDAEDCGSEVRDGAAPQV